MPYIPVSPLSPELTLVKPIGESESRLGPIPNVSDGLPGIGGIGRVELPGIGVFAPGTGAVGMPSVPNLVGPAPVVSPAPSASPAAGAQAIPAPEVTPFPGAVVQPSSTPAPGPSIQPAPTATVAPQPTSTPVPAAGQLESPAFTSPYTTQPITTDHIPPLVETPVQPAAGAVPVKQTPLASTFGQYLKDAAANYNAVQAQADSMIQHLAVGDKVDIHDVALAVQKAALTNQLAIQVRNRLVEAYQEVMRMPV